MSENTDNTVEQVEQVELRPEPPMPKRGRKSAAIVEQPPQDSDVSLETSISLKDEDVTDNLPTPEEDDETSESEDESEYIAHMEDDSISAFKGPTLQDMHAAQAEYFGRPQHKHFG